MSERTRPMRVPLEAVPPRIAAVFWAVVRGARTFREVSAALGYVSASACLHDLREAREAGLIDFEDRKAATMHAKYRIVAFTPLQ